MSDEQLEQSAKFGYMNAASVNADYYAAAKQMADRLGMPVESVIAVPDEAKRQDDMAKIDFKNISKNAPATAAILADDTRSKIVHDDIDNLFQLERRVKQFGELKATPSPDSSISNIFSGLATNFKESFKGMKSSLNLAIADALNDGSERSNAYVDRLKREVGQHQIRASAADPEFESATARGLYGGLASTVQTLPSVAAGAMAGPWAGIALAGIQSGLPAYGKYRERGASPAQAAIGGIGEGVVEAGTELLPMKFLTSQVGKLPVSDFLKGFLAKEMPTEQVATILQDAIDTAIANPNKTWGDYFAERPEAAYQTMLGVLVQTGAFGGIHKLAQHAQRKQADASAAAQVMGDVGELIKQSKVLPRDAETFKSFMQSAVGEDSSISDVYIDTKALVQSGMANKVATLSPSVAEQLQHAEATGTDVRVPLDEYLTNLAPSQFNQSLMEHVKFDPEDFTVAQYNHFEQTYGDALQEQIASALNEKQDDAAFNESKAKVKDQIAAALNEVSRFNPETNDHYATLGAAYYATRAARLGITPEALFAQRGMAVVGDKQSGQYVANESKPVAKLQGNEIADPSTDIATFRQAVRNWYDANLKDTAVQNKASGRDIHFKNAKKAFSTSANPEKLQLFHALRSVVENGAIESSTQPADKTKEPNVKAYHWLTANVMLNGQLKKVGVMLREDANGNLYYNHNPIKEKAPTDQNRSQSTNEAAGYSEGDAFYQSVPTDGDNINLYVMGSVANARGRFYPDSNTIALLKNADLSTFLHESAHFFFENDMAMAKEILTAQTSQQALTDGEQAMLNDVSALLSWHGITGSIDEQLAKWETLSFEEKTSYHEKTAESFEAYLFDGKAPSLELGNVFRVFRAWLLNVYKSLKQFLGLRPQAGQLNDDVRGVFDRMLASTEEIKLAEQARGLLPLFKTLENSGMQPADFAAYHALSLDATQEAVESFQSKALRDMQWLEKAKGRMITKLKRENIQRRRSVRIEVRRQVLSQPVYRAWKFLTARMTADDKISLTPERRINNPDKVDETRDSLFAAIAKLGGINKDDLINEWGIDPKDKPNSGVFGKPVWRVENAGKSLDAMAETLAQYGYLTLNEHGQYDLHELEDKFDSELRGDKVYSDFYDYSQDQEKLAGEDVDISRLYAARIDIGSLYEMGVERSVIDALEARKMTAKNGLHPQLLADTTGGFESGYEFVKALAEAMPPNELIEMLTDEQMISQYSELASEEAIKQAADIAVHNELRQKVLAQEASALDNAMGNKSLLLKAAKDYASRYIGNQLVKNIKPHLFTSAEVRAAKASELAYKKGDIQQAAAEKRNALFSNVAAKLAYDAREEIDVKVKYFKSILKARLPGEYVEQIAALLNKYDFADRSLKEIDRTSSLRDWVQKQINKGDIPAISESLLSPEERRRYEASVTERDEHGELVYKDEEQRLIMLAEAIDRSAKRSYKNITLDELRGLSDTVKNIEHIARTKNRLMVAGEGESLNELKDKLISGLKENAKSDGKNVGTANTPIGKVIQGVQSFLESHIKISSKMKVFDGGEFGVWWSTFIKSANKMASKEAIMRSEATKAMSDILSPILKKVPKLDLIGNGKIIDGVGVPLNWQQRFTVLLNYGNEQNTQRLMDGGIAGKLKNLTPKQISAIVSTFSREEVLAAQAIWDHFDTYKPLIAEKERRVTGVEPDWVIPREVTVRTSDGEAVTLRGGYYPIIYDSRANIRSGQHAEAESSKEMMKAAYNAITTRRSFIKSRIPEIKGRPLLLEMQGVYSGLHDVIHDLSWHEWLIDANRLLNDSSVDETIREHYGADTKKEIMRWRDDIIVGEKKLNHGIEKAAGWVRRHVSAAALTFNLVSAIVQPLGIANTFVVLGKKWTANGIAEYIQSPIEKSAWVREKSEFMRMRGSTMLRDLNELRNKVQGQTAYGEFVGKYGYFLTQTCQGMVDVPTWIGAYNKALSEGNPEENAIAMADQMVKDSQGGGEVVDQAGIVRGNPLTKLFTVFYEFMNTQLNILYTSYQTKERSDFMMDALLIGGIMPVLTKMLRDLIIPGDSDDWDDENWLKTVLMEIGSNAIGMFAFVREAIPAFKEIFGESPYGYTGPAGLRPLVDLGNLTHQSIQREFDSAFFKALINIGGDLSGLPAVQINRAISGAEALDGGETDNPAALLFGYQR